MRVTLPRALALHVDRAVRGGSYGSESEVVADAVRRLMQGDRLPHHHGRGREHALPGQLLFTLGFGLGHLKEQLADVELLITDILRQIERTGRQGGDEQERSAERDEALEQLLRSVRKAAETNGQLVQDISALMR